MIILKYIICGFICIILFSCTTPKYPDWITEQEVKAQIDLVESWINDEELFKAAMFDTVNYVTPEEYAHNKSVQWVTGFCESELPIIQEKYSIDYKFNGYYERQGPASTRSYIFTIIVYNNSIYDYEFWFKKIENKWKLILMMNKEKF